MKKIYFIILIVFVGFFISTFLFSSVSQSGKVGDYFYKNLQSSNYDAIIQILDKDALNQKTKNEWLETLKLNKENLGNSFIYKNTGFHTLTVNNQNIIKLNYSIDNGNGITFNIIELIKRDDGYRIINYYSENKFVINDN
ncbi:MAG: hypothetical protein JXR51_12735 [Bacteroidales bacterium]|nr:hypothetical protein [Bacteroidales bacterium]MBN2758036.1 hypothetical protein [Bacteroidales bacterium]